MESLNSRSALSFQDGAIFSLSAYNFIINHQIAFTNYTCYSYKSVHNIVKFHLNPSKIQDTMI